MELYGVLFAFVLATLSDLTSAQYAIDNLTLSIQRASEGDALTAVCDVKNEPRTRILVYWVRKIHDHDHEVEIATNGVLNDIFKQSQRYSSSYDMWTPNDLRRVRFTLNITNVKTEDSGNIGCRLSGPENERFEVFRDFIVSAPVQQVSWKSSEPNATGLVHSYSNGKSVELREDQVRRFICHVNGSFPKPEVRVLIGDNDITSQFKHHAVLVKGGGQAGLQPLFYKVDVYHDSLKVDYSFNEKQLQCIASLSPSDLPLSVNASEMQKSASINISLLYKPKFLCGMEAFSRLNEPNYNLICKVYSNPEVKWAKVFWTDQSDSSNDTLDTFEDGMKSGDYNSTVIMVSDLETLIVLIITRVYQQHFKTYIFEAENDLGRVAHSVELKQDIGSSPTRSVSSHTICVTSLAASLILVGNLITKWCLHNM